MEKQDRLPNELADFILQSDTVWLGSSYEARREDRAKYPSHVGANARGGRPGFVRVLPSDGRTLVLPDYSGNRLMTSLGNIEASSLAGMTFLDWKTGDILYVTGIARNIVGPSAQSLMPRQNVLTTLFITGFVFIRDALPVRQAPGSDVERSPYSPPIRLLAEEAKDQASLISSDIQALLTSIHPLSTDLAEFTFEVSSPVKIVPGQTAVLDFSQLLGSQQYTHMAMPGSEASLNDDRIRTWTISSFRVGAKPDEQAENSQLASQFTLTMREMPHGLVTGALFTIMRQLQSKMPHILEDARPLSLRVPLVGVSGSFTLPTSPQSDGGRHPDKLLWIAGGIGMTPFLGFLDAMATVPKYRSSYDIVMLLTTREAGVLLPLLERAYSKSFDRGPKLKVHIFTSSSLAPNNLITDEMPFDVEIHKKRLSFTKEQRLEELVPDAVERLPYLCGPPKFEDMIMDALTLAGVERSTIVREGFQY